MNFKKVLCVLMVSVMLMGVVTGCSSAELGLYKLLKEKDQLERYQQYGEIEIDFSIDSLDDMEELPEAKAMVDKIEEICDKYSLVYDSKWDTDNEKGYTIIELKDKKTRKKIEVFSMYMDEETIYANVKQLIETAKLFTDADEINEVSDFFGDAEYISINQKDLEQLVSTEMNDPMQTDLMLRYYDSDTTKAMNECMLDFMDGIIDKVYKDYTLDIVKKSRNKYKVTLDGQSMVKVFVSLLDYSVDHIEELGEYVKGFVEDMDDEQRQILAIYGLDPEQVPQQVDELVQEVSMNKPEIKAAIAYMETLLEEAEIKAILDGIEIEAEFQKIGSSTYKTSIEESFKPYDPVTGKPLFDLKIDFTDKKKKTGPFKVDVPKKNVMSFEELQAKIEELQPKREDNFGSLTSIRINTETGAYEFTSELGVSSGQVNLYHANGAYYLPVEQVKSLIGEEFQVNQQENKVYVDRAEGRVYLKDSIVNLITGTAYINLEELNKLQYLVSVNNDEKTIIIIDLNTRYWESEGSL